MKTKLAQSLPLLGTFIALIIGGAVLMKFTPADAVLDATSDEPPVNGATEPAIVSDVAPTALPVDDATMDGDTPVSSDTATVDETVTDAHVMMAPLEAGAETDANAVRGMYMEANSEITLTDHYLNDVYAVGSTITITGTVDGDVFAAGEHVIIEGTVMGSVRAAGSDIVIKGAVGRNVVAFAGDVEIEDTSHVGGDVLVFAGNAAVKAMVMGNVTGQVGEVLIDAPVEGDVNFDAVQTLTFGSDAYVMGNVAYTSHQTAKVNDAATLLGDVTHTPLNTTDTEAAVTLKAIVSGFKFAVSVISWLGFLVLGIVMLKVLPKYSERVLTFVQSKPAQSLGYGVLATIVPPLVIITVGLTVVGLPLAIAGGLVYLLCLMASKIYAGVLVGKLLWRSSKGMVGPFLLGYTLMSVVFIIMGGLGFMGELTASLLEGLLITTALGAVVKTCQHGRNI